MCTRSIKKKTLLIVSAKQELWAGKENGRGVRCQKRAQKPLINRSGQKAEAPTRVDGGSRDFFDVTLCSSLVSWRDFFFLYDLS